MNIAAENSRLAKIDGDFMRREKNFVEKLFQEY